MRALVFEQWQGGHYFNYLECLVPRLAAISEEVVVAITERAASSDLFVRQLGHLREVANVRFDLQATVPRDENKLLFRRNLGRNVVDAIARNKVDFVFLPSADEQLLILPLLALAGATRQLRGISIEAVVHYKSYTADGTARERALSAVQCQLLRTGVFSQVNFVNFLQYEDAVARRLSVAPLARAAGDPVPRSPRIDRRSAREALGLDTSGRYVGMVGQLDPRKAVPETLAAFRAARLATTDRLLLAGELAPEYRCLVRQGYQDMLDSGRLVVIDRFLSAQELANGFAALDLNCSAYRDFSGLSSLMLKSIAAGVPVIAANQGWSQALVRRFDVGRVVDPARTGEFALAIREALDASVRYVESPAVDRLLQFHSIDNFCDGLLERAANFAGKPRPGPVLQWSWVLEALPPERRHVR